jgi:esterase/lipase
VTFPVLPGAEPWSSDGAGPRARVGILLVHGFTGSPRVRSQLPNLTCPILVAYSRADHSVPPENSKAILRLLGSKDITELVLERSYHVATLDYDLELIEARLTAFADRVAN